MAALCRALSFAVILSTSLAMEMSVSAPIQCDLYIASSTIPNAGLGIFTGVPKKKGDVVGNGDVALPLVDFYWNNDKKGFFYPMIDYVWDGTIMGMEQEVEESDIEAYWPGLDCMVNCNLALLNVEKASPIYDEGGLHRATSPGAGAISPYHNGTTEVIRDIPEGGELFKYYGDDWFWTRFKEFGNIPLLGDYDSMKTLLNKFSKLDSKTQSDLYDVLAKMKEVWDSRTLNALPNSLEDAQTAITEQDLGILQQPAATRSLEWLQQNGKCIDHIVPGQSTIPDAGHGAFAKRDIPVGTVVTGSPLHHVPSRRLFHLYDFEIDKDGKQKRTDVILGEQVAVNYCLGHEESDLLLCPYGAGVNYINHNQTLANVKIQWPKDGDSGHNASWLEMTPDDMAWKFQPSLALDYVATKPIKEGEELFMDYGDVWEAKWQSQVQNWNPPEKWKSYLPASQFNKEHAKVPLRTINEQKTDPYPENLQMRCHQDLIEKKWKGKTVTWHNDEKGFPCRILKRYLDDPYKYDVEIFYVKIGHEKIEEEYFRSGVPRDVIQFVDVPYSTDLHLLKAFRQPLGLPDDMMPQAWRNRAGSLAVSVSTV